MTYTPILPWIILVPALLLAGVWMWWIEWRRNEKFRNIRYLTVVLVIISLAGLTLRPHYPTSVSQETILLTSNYDKVLTDSILKSAGHTFIHLPGVKPYRNSTELSSLHQLTSLQPPLQILGDGIPVAYQDYLEKISYTYLPSHQPHGILFIEEKTYTLNRESSINFIFNSQNGNEKIVLTDPTGKIDSMNEVQSGIQQLSLKFIPKQAGTFRYTMQVISVQDTIIEQLPVTIEEPRKLNILIVAKYPTAELRFLKNYLSNQQHAVSIRYQVSQQQFQKEFINTPATSLTITAQRLRDTDLLLLDEETYSTLPEREFRIIDDAIKQGLGLLLLADESSLKSKRKFSWLIGEMITMDTSSVIVQQQKYKTAVVPIRLQTNPELMVTAKTSDGRIAGASSYYGKGKTGVQLLRNSYQLILHGHEIVYAQVWSDLIDQVARDTYAETLQILTPFPRMVNDPIKVQLLSAERNPSVTLDSVVLPLRESALTDHFYTATGYATNEGWHSLQSATTSRPLYVFDHDAWKSVQVANQISATMRYSVPQESSNTQAVIKPIPQFIFYLLFLLGVGFLWLVPKL